MRKSILEPANALKEKLFEIPELVTAFANKESNVCHNWIAWLTELEAIFKKYNFTQCAEVAGYRALIITSKITAGTEKRSQKRKQQFQIALSTVQPVQQLLSDKSDELNEKIDQVRLLLRQIVTPAKDAGLIKYKADTNFTSFMESLLVQFKNHKQIGHEINNAIATVGKYDVLRILAEEIELDDKNAQLPLYA